MASSTLHTSRGSNDIVEEPFRGGHWLTHGGGTLDLRTSSTTNTRGDRGLVAWSEE